MSLQYQLGSSCPLAFVQVAKGHWHGEDTFVGALEVVVIVYTKELKLLERIGTAPFVAKSDQQVRLDWWNNCRGDPGFWKFWEQMAPKVLKHSLHTLCGFNVLGRDPLNISEEGFVSVF